MFTEVLVMQNNSCNCKLSYKQNNNVKGGNFKSAVSTIILASVVHKESMENAFLK